jgi:tRNA(Ile)-lysidine synthase
VSVEQAAHTARHQFFERAAARLTATAVAVAHTRDDQAETFLLRLLRGAGPRGLGGMHPRAGLVIRPFIETPRSEIRAFLREQHLEFREDASNADRTIPRNRIRHELIPYLETRFSPGIVDVLDREAAIAREDAEFLDHVAAAASSRLIARTPQGVEIDVSALVAEPPAIARRVIRAAQQIVSGGRFVGFEAVDAVLAFAVSNSTGALDLPGHRVNRRGKAIVLTESPPSRPRRDGEAGPPRRGRDGEAGPSRRGRDGEAGPSRRGRYGEAGPSRPGRYGGASNPMPAASFLYELAVPGQVEVPEAACAISADTEIVESGQSAARRWPLVARGDLVIVEGSQLCAPLVVRNRRPGDSFRPLGLQGHKKLQDFFVDAKVLRAERDTIPLVVDSKGQIVWVAGHAVAEDFRVTDRTRAVVILKREPI